MASLLLPISSRFDASESSSSGDCYEVPEDGFDFDSDEEMWVVRKTFLELKSETSDSGASVTMRRFKSEPSRRRLSISASKDDEPMYISDATCSTGESSSEEMEEEVTCRTRNQRCVQFASTIAELQPESPTLSRTRAESQASILSIRTADSPMYRRRADSKASVLSIRTADSPMYRTRADSKASISRARADSKASIFSIKTDYSSFAYDHVDSNTSDHVDSNDEVLSGPCASGQSPMYRTRADSKVSRARIDSTASVLSTKTDYSAYAYDHVDSNPYDPNQAVMSSPCALTPPAATQMPMVPPGDFSSKTKSTEQHAELEQLQNQQRLLEEQRARLVSMAGGMPVKNVLSHQQPPGNWNKHQGIRQQSPGDVKQHKRTAVVLRNLPDGFTRAKIEELLNSQGFAKKFNFIYAPVKFEVMATIGYAFVNFVSPEAAQECHVKLDGFTGWSELSENACEVTWSEKDQGLAAIVTRHRNSPVMHSSVSDDFKPALYKNGARADFPAPTKKIRAPRTQRYKNEGMSADDEVTDFN